jgi:hypothetical protein
MNRLLGKRLLKLSQSGHLNACLQALPEVLQIAKFMGSGDDATAFDYTTETLVKICSKHIGYFRAHPESNAIELMEWSQRLCPYVLPMLNVLYEDDYVFVYEQAKCKPFHRSQVDLNAIKNLIEIEINLIENQAKLSTSTHNLGLDSQGRVVVFDYHDIRQTHDGERSEKFPLRHLMTFILTYTHQKQALSIRRQVFTKNSMKGLPKDICPEIIDLMNMAIQSHHRVIVSELIPYLIRLRQWALS